VFFLRGEGAELVRFVWQNATGFTLAHDGSLADAAAWSRIDVAFDLPEGAGVIVACEHAPDWHETVELGTV
jgi:hypothetical protein